MKAWFQSAGMLPLRIPVDSSRGVRQLLCKLCAVLMLNTAPGIECGCCTMFTDG
ncbi:MAG: hypothetical protein ACRC62_28895 [Microcoleus sp.]